MLPDYDQKCFEEVRGSLPTDHSRQVRASQIAELVLTKFGPAEIVDVGCGEGKSREMFQRFSPRSNWTGVDIAQSDEVARRSPSSDGQMLTYDGINLPFAAGSIDFAYSSQVLEHVVDPVSHLSEIYRILRIQGSLVGSTSNLEPFHSRSFWNFTPWGFWNLARQVGFEVVELRPGIDGPTLIDRSLRNRPANLNRFFVDESPINQSIEMAAAAKGMPIELRNWLKLCYSGHFVFHLRK